MTAHHRIHAKRPLQLMRKPKTIANPNRALIQEEVTINASDTPDEPLETDDCLYCASLSVEMKKRAEPMAQTLETAAAIDVAIMAAPVALGEIGSAGLGLDFEAETAMLEDHVATAVARFDAEGFTEAQEAALQNNPNLEAAFRGSRIDQFFKEAVSADERLSHLQITQRFRLDQIYITMPMSGGM